MLFDGCSRVGAAVPNVGCCVIVADLLVVSLVAVGVGLAISGLAVVIIVSFLMMPRLARVVWGLPRKIVTVWTALFVLRGFVSIVDAVLWK